MSENPDKKVQRKAPVKPKTPPQDDKIDTPVLIYILFLASLVLPLIPALMGAGWAFSEKKNAPDWIASHYDYLIQTLLKGFMLLIGGIALILVYIGLFIVPAIGLWWLIRCIKGLRHLINKEAVPNPQTWLI